MSNQLIDQLQLEELKELLEEDFEPLIHTFLEDCKRRIDELVLAYQSGNNAAGYNAVHTLKGASANVGATHLTELCYELQSACRQGNIIEQQKLITAIKEEELKVEHYLREFMYLK